MLPILAMLPLLQAMPLSEPVVSLKPPLVFTTSTAITCDDGEKYRTLWQIVLSCASTLFLCTWVSIHPNIPGPHEHWSKVLLRRLGMMLALLIAPELMVSWAMRQRTLARQLAKKYEQYEWTETHGFFAIMGGFMECEGDREVRILLPHELEGYSLTGRGDFPRIATEEITDKSKRELIAKGLAVLQVGWFLSECISRLVFRLPIAEIELVTFAFAVLSIAMFILWWNKPFDVRRAVRVYKTSADNTLPTDNTSNMIEQLEQEPPEPERPASFATRFCRSVKVLATLPIQIARYITRNWWFIFAPITQLIEIATGTSHVVEDDNRISTFFPETEPGTLVTFSGMIPAMVFGAIHCVAWRFTFPSYTEQIMWRFSSIAITSGPPTWVPLVWLFYKKPRMSLAPILITMLLVYIACRFFLLTLPLLSLRALPPNTYKSIRWTTFLPHL